jgi:hypothetical protein
MILKLNSGGKIFSPILFVKGYPPPKLQFQYKIVARDPKPEQ